MKLKEHLLDKKYFILFYFILMNFITAVIYLDPTVKVSLHNILYINVVSFFFFLLYIFIQYLFRKRYYTIINNIIKNEKKNILNCLPNPKTYEQKLYNQLLMKMYEEQNEKIEELYSDKRENQEYITSWVHEIKTPIAVSRLIIENSIEKPKEDILDSLEEEIDKIYNYVEQTLYYSRIDSFSRDYFINEIDISRILKNIIKKHAKTFINKKIKIKMDIENSYLTTDGKWLFFIIDQIISNSLKYTNEAGKISIDFEKDKNEKRLIIHDNGVGIKPEDIYRVFHKGFTGHTGRENYKSTGMGLYLAKKLTRKLGHDISINSVYGKYTKVTIHFPKLLDYYTMKKG